jgi:hypothetical protein
MSNRTVCLALTPPLTQLISYTSASSTTLAAQSVKTLSRPCLTFLFSQPLNLKATKMSFEWFGGILAREWLLKHGASQDLADSVAECIFRHTGQFALRWTMLAQLQADFVGGKIVRRRLLLSWI